MAAEHSLTGRKGEGHQAELGAAAKQEGEDMGDEGRKDHRLVTH